MTQTTLSDFFKAGKVEENLTDKDADKCASLASSAPETEEESTKDKRSIKLEVTWDVRKSKVVSDAGVSWTFGAEYKAGPGVSCGGVGGTGGPCDSKEDGLKNIRRSIESEKRFLAHYGRKFKVKLIHKPHTYYIENYDEYEYYSPRDEPNLNLYSSTLYGAGEKAKETLIQEKSL